MAHRGLAAALAALICGALSTPALGAKLSQPDREALARALAAHRPHLSVLFAAGSGANGALAGRLQALGAAVEYRDDEVDFIQADVPIGRVLRAAALDGVLAANIDRKRPRPEPQLGSAPPDETGLPIPDASTPAINPFIPTGDIGAPQFVAAHPSWDGRGTILGVIDDGLDVTTPQLQSARLADGTPTPKIIDYVTTAGPEEPTWVGMSQKVTAVAGSLTFDGDTYTAPAATGSFRIGKLDERAFGFPMIDNDVNRDGNPQGSSGLFAVLWEETSNRVWVDTDQDRDFSEQKALTDYVVAHDFDVFGTDNPNTAIRETVPFVVQTDSLHKRVDINIEESEGHGTSTASVAVGTGFFGSSATGVAPAARLALARDDHTEGAVIKAGLHLVKKDHADVLSLSLGSDFGSSDDVQAIAFDRIVRKYDVEVFGAGGNERATLNTVVSPGTALNAIAVAASAKRATTKAVSGYSLGAPEDIEWYSSRGPSIDGALKPDLAAPGMTWTALPRWRDPGCCAPVGYQRSRGTSFATPMASGGALLLLNAARASNVPAHADQLRLALFSSARTLAAASTHAQGRGVENVTHAWNLLKTNLQPVAISALAPVDDGWSREGFVSPTGPGLFLREGWTVGDTGTKNVTLTRTTGSDADTAYKLSLTGDDGTFDIPPSVTLPKGASRNVAVAIHPTAFGVHAAILNVDDPATLGIDKQVGLLVAAAEHYDDAHKFSITHTGSLANDQIADFVFAVPDDADGWASRLSSDAPDGRLDWSISDPLGPEFTQRGPTRPEGFLFAVNTDRFASRVYEYALATAFQDSATTPYKLKTEVSGHVTIKPPSLVIDPATVGTTYDRTLTFATGGVGFEGLAHGTGLGPVQNSRESIDENVGFLVKDITVPAGADHLNVRIGNPSNPDADLDLFVDHCDDPECNTGAGYSSTSPTNTERIDAAHPRPGVWTIGVIDSQQLPGPLSFDLTVVVTNPANGSVKVDDASTYHPSHTSWTRSIHVTPRSVPPGGATLRGFVRAGQTWSNVNLRNITGP